MLHHCDPISPPVFELGGLVDKGYLLNKECGVTSKQTASGAGAMWRCGITHFCAVVRLLSLPSMLNLVSIRTYTHIPSAVVPNQSSVAHKYRSQLRCADSEYLAATWYIPICSHYICTNIFITASMFTTVSFLVWDPSTHALQVWQPYRTPTSASPSAGIEKTHHKRKQTLLGRPDAHRVLFGQTTCSPSCPESHWGLHAKFILARNGSCFC